MALVRWESFRELEDIQTRLNRMFGSSNMRLSGEHGLTVAEWAPAIDVEETDQEYLVVKDGVLIVQLPTSAVAAPQAISVKVS